MVERAVEDGHEERRALEAFDEWREKKALRELDVAG